MTPRLDLRAATPADAPQLDWSENERGRLANRIEQDFLRCRSDHQRRMDRFVGYYRRWRNLTDLPALGEEDTSNFMVPLTQWQVFGKWAKEHASLFGEDAEVVANPVGPDDQWRVRKVGRYMTWRLFSSMYRLVLRASVFNFRKILFGRSIAFAPWIQHTHEIALQDGGTQTITDYDGPDFVPEWPDDIMTPAEDVETIQEFSFVIRKYHATADQLLDGEEDGLYSGIEENFDEIFNAATDMRRRHAYDERIKLEKDEAEGVTYAGLSAANALRVWEWYGKWRPLKGKGDAREDNLKRRDLREMDIVVKYLPDIRRVIGIQDLRQMYPLKRQPRPFVEAALVQDGSYWCPGFGEMLESVEAELTTNHNLATQAWQFSIGPVVLYNPASGYNPGQHEYRPFQAIAVENPALVRLLENRANIEPAVVREQGLITISERVTGLTDQNIGRTQDRPNAPRTARQTMALLEEGDVRASLEMSALREHWGEILRHFWELEQMYGSERTFFRVTEEDANGLFPTSKGGAFLDADDRCGRYDFTMKFATNAHSREATKQNQLALYQIDLQNPLVINNPRALWCVLDKIHRAFGDERFAEIVPEPADIGLPKKPIDEWTAMLEGEDVAVNPMDNDEMHIRDHMRRLGEEEHEPNADRDACKRMEWHIVEHSEQIRTKQLMQSLTAGLAQSLNNGSPGLAMGGTPVPLQNVQDTISQLTNPAGAPGAPQQKPQGGPPR